MSKASHASPRVWYMGTGYTLPAGIEAHILHYATEMRNHGYATKVVVFKPLPADRHRFLAALEDRGIPILSLSDAALPAASWKARVLFAPWFLYILLRKRRRPDVASFRIWALRRESMLELRRRLRRDCPDIVHVFGRLPSDAWRELPAKRTIYHEMMTGTVDRHWNGEELNEFRSFAARAARFFAPGGGVEANVMREFGVSRRIDPIFTMCPDEAGSGPLAPRRGPGAGLRFGVICRLTGQKGITFLLEALRLYRDRHGTVDFTFAGIGPMEPDILEFAKQHGLTGIRVVRVPSAPAVLGNIDVFVHPSVDDAMPVAIAEALMCSVPCLVCRVGGCADLVRDGEEGIVIEPRRTDLILAGMERFAAMSPEDFEAFRARARRRYEEVCLPSSVGHGMAEHYGAVLREAALPAGGG